MKVLVQVYKPIISAILKTIQCFIKTYIQAIVSVYKRSMIRVTSKPLISECTRQSHVLCSRVYTASMQESTLYIKILRDTSYMQT